MDLILRRDEKDLRVELRAGTETVAWDGRPLAALDVAGELGLGIFAEYPVRRPQAWEVQRASAELGRILFPDPIRRGLLQRLDGRRFLRISLRLLQEDWELLPWELADLGPRDSGDVLFGPVCLNPRVRFVRAPVGVPAAPGRACPASPRILIAWSDPRSPRWPRLAHLQDEVDAVFGGVGSRAAIRVVEDATPEALRRRILECRPHVFHYLGHGERTVVGSSLALQGARPGSEVSLSPEELAPWLTGAGVRLAVLSACDSAGGSFADRLVELGVPAAVGMQSGIADEHRATAVRALYAALAGGATADEALLESRAVQRDLLAEWAVPVLVTSGPPIAVATSGSPSETRESGLVGRRDLLHRCRELLEGDERTPVVLTGPGGIGKTRLAEELLAAVGDWLPDGGYFVSCESRASASELASAVALCMELPTSAGVSLESLMEALADRSAIVVLDCADRLAAEGALQSLAALTPGAPGVRFVATSRIRPRAFAGICLDVPPLDLEGEHGSLSASVRLFEVSLAHLGRRLLPTELEAADDVCRLLAGVPLAIRLAAARLGVCSMGELLEDVRASRIRSVGDGRAPGRHANLAQVVQDSFQLLPAADRHLLFRVAVFTGEFTRRDALAVLEVDRFEVIDAFSRLRAHSLLDVREEEGTTRFRMLDAIREHCLAMAEEGELALELDAVRHSHARHYAGVAEEIARLGRAGEWAVASARLWEGIGNMRAAMEFAAANRLDSLTLAFANVLARPLFEAGLWSDFENLAAGATAAIERTGREDTRIVLLGLQGALAARRKDARGTEAAWRERLEVCRRTGDVRGTADCLIDLGCEAHSAGYRADAERLLREGLDVARRAGDTALEATACVMLAKSALGRRARSEASSWLAQAASATAGATDRDAMLMVKINFGVLGRALGDPSSLTSAVEALREAVAGHRWFHAAWALRILAEGLEEDHPRLAHRLYAAAAGLYRRLRSERAEACAQRCRSLEAGWPGEVAYEGLDAAYRDPVAFAQHSLFLVTSYAQSLGESSGQVLESAP
ncbi:MAG: CHAT domain-containing protein [Fimbriimonas sp.]